MSGAPYSIEFYEESSGAKPALRWIREDLSVRQRRALGHAMYRLLQRYGVGSAARSTVAQARRRLRDLQSRAELEQ